MHNKQKCCESEELVVQMKSWVTHNTHGFLKVEELDPPPAEPPRGNARLSVAHARTISLVWNVA